MISNTILKLQNLSLNYGEVQVLMNVNLELQKGKITALVGPSGSGKTSLLMLVAGLEIPSSGEVIFDNQRIDQYSENKLAKLRRQNIGVLFQAFHLHPSLTAEENAAMPLIFDNNKNALDIARQELKKLDLGHRLKHYPAQLSGGEQQRVALVRAFVNKPKLVLADEPTGNLDSNTGKKVIDNFFTSIKTSDSAALIVTHDITLAKKCDRIISISSGELHA